jgi:hypothetical protein
VNDRLHSEQDWDPTRLSDEEPGGDGLSADRAFVSICAMSCVSFSVKVSNTSGGRS